MSELLHYGTPRHSGRYPWGSGEDPYQRSQDFLGYVDALKRQGLSEVEIAKGVGMTTSELRAKKSIAKSEKRAADSAEALRLKNKGYSNIAIGERMGINESSVRSLLDPAMQERAKITEATANVLKSSIADKKYIDVGVGTEAHLGISRTKLKTAISQLEDDGYKVWYVQVPQVGTGKKTSIMVLADPESTYSEVFKNRDQIQTVSNFSQDGGRNYYGLEPVRNVDSKRIKIQYAEEGGINKDGVIELRRGIDDISLGSSRYAQVRIGVDGTHYLKGMAMYADDLPDGIDIRFNTNKKQGTPPEDVFKKMKADPENPFGSSVRQRHYIDKDGKDQLSALNIVREEGEWDTWSKSLSSQVLSKQSPLLAKKQLGLAYDAKKEEFDEYLSLTNPAVKKRLLESFADDCDSASVSLKAAALPRQSSKVILPLSDIKDTEVYAPTYRDGEQVVLIRYPHGGIFEIPQLRVNNKSESANRLIKNATDAIGISPKVAEQLSGADFDGDSVLVIPNKNGNIQTSSPLKGLKNFDPKETYKAYPGMPRMSPKTKQLKMGDVSNLITDMTIKGAKEDEICRAVRHSMVVIDAEKHYLNYKQSYIDNGIGELKRKYQGSERAGASTLISKASSEQRVRSRKEVIDPDTGEKKYLYPGDTYTTKRGEIKVVPSDTYVNKAGVTVERTMKSTKMGEARDAYALSSGTMIENVYASHANKLKALANDARKTALSITPTQYSPSAKLTYTPEVKSLLAKLNLAIRNKPLERQAQLLANKAIAQKKRDNPDMDAADLKKLKGQELERARLRSGAKKEQIELTAKEWEAIQAGAISHNVLTQIIQNTDLDKLKQLATPRTFVTLTPAKEARARSLFANGYTQAEVAEALGVSVSTLSESLK